MQQPDILNHYQSANTLRRLAALFYDCLLIIGILFIASVPVIALNQGEAVQHHLLYQLYLLALWFLFYGLFWTHNGQTLGMAAWRIQLVDYNGKPVSWKQALIRFFTSGLGLANLFCRLHQLGLGWQDIASKSVIIAKNTSK